MYLLQVKGSSENKVYIPDFTSKGQWPQLTLESKFTRKRTVLNTGTKDTPIKSKQLRRCEEIVKVPQKFRYSTSQKLLRKIVILQRKKTKRKPKNIKDRRKLKILKLRGRGSQRERCRNWVFAELKTTLVESRESLNGSELPFPPTHSTKFSVVWGVLQNEKVQIRQNPKEQQYYQI